MALELGVWGFMVRQSQIRIVSICNLNMSVMSGIQILQNRHKNYTVRMIEGVVSLPQYSSKRH